MSTSSSCLLDRFVSLIHSPDPFAQKYPESADATIPAQAISARFNPSGPFAGHYLAAGGIDGLVEVWDVETRGVARVLEGHVKAVGRLRSVIKRCQAFGF